MGVTSPLTAPEQSEAMRRQRAQELELEQQRLKEERLRIDQEKMRENLALARQQEEARLKAKQVKTKEQQEAEEREKVEKKRIKDEELSRVKKRLEEIALNQNEASPKKPSQPTQAGLTPQQLQLQKDKAAVIQRLEQIELKKQLQEEEQRKREEKEQREAVEKRSEKERKTAEELSLQSQELQRRRQVREAEEARLDEELRRLAEEEAMLIAQQKSLLQQQQAAAEQQRPAEKEVLPAPQSSDRISAPDVQATEPEDEKKKANAEQRQGWLETQQRFAQEKELKQKQEEEARVNAEREQRERDKQARHLEETRLADLEQRRRLAQVMADQPRNVGGIGSLISSSDLQVKIQRHLTGIGSLKKAIDAASFAGCADYSRVISAIHQEAIKYEEKFNHQRHDQRKLAELNGKFSNHLQLCNTFYQLLFSLCELNFSFVNSERVVNGIQPKASEHVVTDEVIQRTSELIGATKSKSLPSQLEFSIYVLVGKVCTNINPAVIPTIIPTIIQKLQRDIHTLKLKLDYDGPSFRNEYMAVLDAFEEELQQCQNEFNDQRDEPIKVKVLAEKVLTHADNFNQFYLLLSELFVFSGDIQEISPFRIRLAPDVNTSRITAKANKLIDAVAIKGFYGVALSIANFLLKTLSAIGIPISTTGAGAYAGAIVGGILGAPTVTFTGPAGIVVGASLGAWVGGSVGFLGGATAANVATRKVGFFKPVDTTLQYFAEELAAYARNIRSANIASPAA